MTLLHIYFPVNGDSQHLMAIHDTFKRNQLFHTWIVIQTIWYRRHTVDGRNPAPVDSEFISLKDFIHSRWLAVLFHQSTVGPTDVGEDPSQKVSLPNQTDKLHPPWVLRCSKETWDVTYSFQVRLVLMLWKTHLFHPWKWTWNTIMNCHFPFQLGDFWVPAVDISGGIHWYHHPWSRIATSRDWWGTKPKRNWWHFEELFEAQKCQKNWGSAR